MSFCLATPLFLSVALAVPLPAQATGTQGLETRAARFQATLDELYETHRFPGATAAFIVDGGESATAVVGFADVEAERRMRADTRMQAGSIGKTFVSAVVLSLARDKVLELDQRLAHWLGKEPWFARLPNAGDITLRHLLQHRSGIRDHVEQEAFVEAVARETDPDRVMSPVEMIGFVVDHPPLFAVGEGYSYTDTGYILLGLVIERATGSNYYEVLRERLLEPLQLTETIPAEHRRLPKLAAGYTAAGNPLGLPPKLMMDGQLLVHPRNEWTGGGLASTSLGLARWAKLLYEGRAMEAPYVEELVRRPDGGAGGYYGLGVRVETTPLGLSYGHSGWFPGYLSRVAYFPDQRVAVALQVNAGSVPGIGAGFMKLAAVAVGKAGAK